MPFVSLLLRLNVVQIIRVARLSEEGLVLVLFVNFALLFLCKFALGVLLQLVGERDRQVLPPDLELGLQLRVVRQLREQ